MKKEILAALYHGKMEIVKEAEGEGKLSQEYEAIYEKLVGSLNEDQYGLLDNLLDKESEIEAVQKENLFIQYVTLGAQLYHELIGGNGSKDSFTTVIHQLFDENCSLHELIQDESEGYKEAAMKSEEAERKLISTYPEMEEEINEYLAAISHYQVLHEEDVFEYGFKTGAQLMMEIMNIK